MFDLEKYLTITSSLCIWNRCDSAPFVHITHIYLQYCCRSAMSFVQSFSHCKRCFEMVHVTTRMGIETLLGQQTQNYHFHSFSFFFIIFHSFSFIFFHFHSFSFIFNHFQSFSIIFINFYSSLLVP